MRIFPIWYRHEKGKDDSWEDERILLGKNIARGEERNNLPAPGHRDHSVIDLYSYSLTTFTDVFFNPSYSFLLTSGSSGNRCFTVALGISPIQ
jgi:hypothetical protein